MEHNVYYDGKVQSLGFQSDHGEATVGVCEPGTYVVPTDTAEHLTFLSGRGRYRFAEHEWKPMKTGDTVVIPPDVQVTWEVAPGSDVCYFCVFR